LLDESSKAVLIGARLRKRASERRDYIRSTDDRRRQHVVSLEVSMPMVRSLRWIAVCGSLPASVALNGAVSHLDPQDLSNNYTALQAGLTVAGGVGIAVK
jgi:hypothetical protein